MSRVTERVRRVKLGFGSDGRHRGMWWRLYASDLDDVRLQTLSFPLFRTWINLACLASKSKGRLPSIGQIAFSLRITEHEAGNSISMLIDAGLIIQDVHTPDGLQIADWTVRQYVSDLSSARVKKHRSKRRNVSDAHDETLHVTPETYSPSFSASISTTPSQEKYSEVHTRAGVHVGARNGYARAKAGEGSV